jgi:hypothetical protein
MSDAHAFDPHEHPIPAMIRMGHLARKRSWRRRCMHGAHAKLRDPA